VKLGTTEVRLACTHFTGPLLLPPAILRITTTVVVVYEKIFLLLTTLVYVDWASPLGAVSADLPLSVLIDVAKYCWTVVCLAKHVYIFFIIYFRERWIFFNNYLFL
jgi:hypothetical protein